MLWKIPHLRNRRQDIRGDHKRWKPQFKRIQQMCQISDYTGKYNY